MASSAVIKKQMKLSRVVQHAGVLVGPYRDAERGWVPAGLSRTQKSRLFLKEGNHILI